MKRATCARNTDLSHLRWPAFAHKLKQKNLVWWLSFCVLISALVLPLANLVSPHTALLSQTAALSQAVAIALNSLFGLVALALIWRFDLGRRVSRRWIFIIATVLGCIAVLSSPLLEDDHYRYLWDAYQWHTQGSPYRFPPDAFFADDSLPWHWQEVLTGINNPELKTIYGPVLQSLFALAYFIAPGQLWAWQLVLLVIHLLGLLVLLRVSKHKSLLLAYAVHPLILQESLASAHPDMLVGILLLLAYLAWQKRAVKTMGALLAVALATKVSVLVVVPLFCLVPRARDGADITPWQLARTWVVPSAASLVVVLLLLYLPVIVHSLGRSGLVSELESLIVFGNQWRFNPLGFRVLDSILPPPWPRLLSAAVVFTACLSCVLLGYLRDGRDWVLPVVFVLLLLLLVAPVVNPWYWLWLIPLAVYLNRWRVLVMSALAPVSYCNGTVLAQIAGGHQAIDYSPFLVPWWLTLIQLLVLLWVLAGERRSTLLGSCDE